MALSNAQAARDANGQQYLDHISPFDSGGTQHGIEPNASMIVEGSPPTADRLLAMYTSAQRGTASEMRSRSSPPRSSNLRSTLNRLLEPSAHEPPRPERQDLHNDSDSEMSHDGKLNLVHHIVVHDHAVKLYEHDLAIKTLQNKVSHLLDLPMPHQYVEKPRSYKLARGDVDSPEQKPQPEAEEEEKEEVKDADVVHEGSPPSASNVIDFGKLRKDMLHMQRRLDNHSVDIHDVKQEMKQLPCPSCSPCRRPRCQREIRRGYHTHT